MAEPLSVQVTETDGRFQLTVNGEPYYIKGAGVTNIGISTLAKHGGNSIRTWGIDQAQDKLDQALEHGVTVALNLPVASERFGMDYDNEAMVLAQLERVRRVVIRYRNHPALLSWVIGNELDLNHTNPKVWNAVGHISDMIHDLDPFHPTTTTITSGESEVIDVVRARAPSLDYLSIQLYGAIVLLPKYAREALKGIPFVVSEYGPLGHWEVAKTSWGAGVEMHSSEKAERVLRTHQKDMADIPNLMGTYVFLWGQKQERTPTWYSMFMETGESTEVVDVMQYVWTGEWPDNRAPVIKHMKLKGRNAYTSVQTTAGKTYKGEVSVSDPDNDPLRFHWHLKRDSDATAIGGDFEANIPDIDGFIDDPDAPSIKFTAPPVAGRYRLFVDIFDGQGHAAHANIPLLVRPR